MIEELLNITEEEYEIKQDSSGEDEENPF